MFLKAFSTLFLAAVAIAQDNGLSVATPPSVQQCRPVQLTWSGGKAPYWVDIIPYQQLSAEPLAALLSSTSETSYTWTPQLPEGTSINIRVKDSVGTNQYSSQVVIQKGDTTCTNSTSSAGGESGTGGGAAGATGGSATTGGASETSAGGAASPTAGGAATETSAGGAASPTSAGGAASQTSAGGAAASSAGAAAEQSSAGAGTGAASSAASAAGSAAASAKPSSAGSLKAASFLTIAVVAAAALFAF